MWQPADSDELVLDWIARGWVRADTPIRHRSWVEPQTVGLIKEFRDALPTAVIDEASPLPPEERTDDRLPLRLATRDAYHQRYPEPSSLRSYPERLDHLEPPGYPEPPSQPSQPSFPSSPGVVPLPPPTPPPAPRWRGPHPAGASALGFAAGAWCCAGPFLAIPAIIRGTRAIREAEANPTTYSDAGSARLAIVLAWLDLCAWTMIMGRAPHHTDSVAFSYGLLVSALLTASFALATDKLPSLRHVRSTFAPLGIAALAVTMALRGSSTLRTVRAEAKQMEQLARLCDERSGEALKVGADPHASLLDIDDAFTAAEDACRSGKRLPQAEAMLAARRMRSARARAELERKREAERPPPPPLGPAVVSAETLVSAYAEDTSAADVRFKDQSIRLTGKAGPVRKDARGASYVVVGANASFEKDVVHCFLREGQLETAKRLVPRADVVLSATVTGKAKSLLGTVVSARDCSLP